MMSIISRPTAVHPSLLLHLLLHGVGLSSLEQVLHHFLPWSVKQTLPQLRQMVGFEVEEVFLSSVEIDQILPQVEKPKFLERHRLAQGGVDLFLQHRQKLEVDGPNAFNLREHHQTHLLQQAVQGLKVRVFLELLQEERSPLLD